MLIVADENILAVSEAFSSLGEVRVMPGRAIDRASVVAADVLVVRSVTPVDRNLLRGSRVRFVATATAGSDHVDAAYLAAAGIGFAAAPGCNANSVAEYVIAALLALERCGKLELARSSIGVVGVGHVGERVATYAAALGMQVLCNDPPKARRTGDRRLVSLDDLMACDVITVHVPLTETGRDATRLLFDGRRIARMKRGAVLINTSRGEVVDAVALKSALRSGHLGGAVLDVWWGEPRIDTELLDAATLATPHVAGYSVDGKLNGTGMVYRAACRFFGVPEYWSPPAPHAVDVPVEPSDDLHDIVKRVYDIQRDDRCLRERLRQSTTRVGETFDAFRRGYPLRWEFHHYRPVGERMRGDLPQRLRLLGFRTPS